MAKLTGVKTLNDREIEYGGERYVKTEGPVQLGDILRMNDGVSGFGLTRGAFYEASIVRDYILGCVDDAGNLREIIDVDLAESHAYVAYTDQFIIYRRVNQIPRPSSEIRALIEQKRAEIAELEALIAPSVGDFVRVVDGHDAVEFEHGEIAKVSRVDKSGDSLPYEIDGIFSDKSEWVSADAVEKITPAEAKAALIAKINTEFEGGDAA